MATDPHSTDRLTSEPFAPPSGLSAVGDHLPFLMTLATLPTMSRWQLRRIADRAIECLDLTEADPDLEANGDELDGTNAEDEIGNNHLSHTDLGAGCPISDPDCGIDDLPHDDEGEAEREEGVISAYGIDQRIADVGHGYQPWDIDREGFAGGGR